LHKLVKNYAHNKLAGSGTDDVLVMPAGGVALKRKERPNSHVAIIEAEIRDSSRPGSQAPHAPPALTFGLPGKQRVNPVRRERVLINPVNTLPRNR
jgi:hypothetical protein